MATAVTNFDQFAGLRAGAARNDPEVLREVAGQFEALFIRTMFKSMREASLAEPIFGQSDQHESYQQMLDDQYAVELASGEGIGLARMLVQQLGGSESSGAIGDISLKPPAAVNNAVSRMPIAHETYVNSTSIKRHWMPPDAGSRIPDMHAVTTAEQPVAGQVGTVPDWSTPEDFLAQVWPFAEKAARRLNVAPEALVAQAALETGWGAHVMAHRNGKSSYNLFGIKASHNWTGNTISKPTLEYRNGIVESERAAFRSYTDLDASFDDYARFIESQPRYESVMNKGDDVTGFANALQDSGYATDPEYARKIERVLDSDVMRKVLPWLKGSASTPIQNTHPTGIR